MDLRILDAQLNEFFNVLVHRPARYNNSFNQIAKQVFHRQLVHCGVE